MANNLNIALHLARRNIFVFSCREKPGDPYKNKRGEMVTPDIKDPYWHREDLLHGYHSATLDPELIKRWWKRWPGALVGIALEQSGIYALDADMHTDEDNGIKTLESLRSKHDEGRPLPAGPAQNTITGGGMHILFRVPAGVRLPGKLGPGLDVKHHGYICTGALPDGRSYKPIKGCEFTLPIPETPAWLVDLFRSLTEKTVTEADRKQREFTTAGDKEKWAAELLDRLTPWRCDDYEEWLHVGMALSELGAGGLNLWDNWSKKSPKYEPGACEDKWDSFNGSGITLGSLYFWAESDNPKARSNGYQVPEEPPFDLSEMEARQPGEEIITTPAGAAATTPPAEFTPKTYADIDGLVGPITWDCEGWLARGFLTMLAGETGQGKSLLMMYLAGCYTQGWPWPNGKQFNCETGHVLWCEAESAQALNLQRMKSWGIPLDRVYAPLSDPLMDLRIKNAEHRAALTNIAKRPEVKLVVIDSLSGMTGGDKENSSESGAITKWLAELGKETGKTVVLSHHLRKRGLLDSDTVDLDRVRGSGAIVQFARVIWSLDLPDPHNKEHKRLSVIKSNLDKFPEPVGMTIDDKGLIHFGTAPETPKVETVTDRAIDLLLSLLAKDPQPFDEVEKAYTAAGISKPTIDRAKKKLGIVSFKQGSNWHWSLPAKEEDIQ